MVWVQGRQEEKTSNKEVCVSCPHSTILRQDCPLPPAHAPQILICKFFVLMTYTIYVLLKTSFSYVQSLYQNTMKILTTEIDEHLLFSRIRLKRYLSNGTILPHTGCNCLKN